MADSPNHSTTNPLVRISEEYLERCRQGEMPSIEEYTSLYPELAEQIRDLFPALGLVEGLKPASNDEETVLTGRPLVPQDQLPTIPDYRIFREIGRGGMGVVYEAEHLALGRRVALKVVPSSHGSDETFIERFRQEARAAAAMHHSNIVPVFDVGSTTEWNYYAMQFIVGDGLDRVVQFLRNMRQEPEGELQPDQTLVAQQTANAITTNWSKNKPADADAQRVQGTQLAAETERYASATTSNISAVASQQTYVRNVAKVGAEVADALQHAHERGIIHRDIKPSNILLDTEGTAWVADFGLAKAEDVQLTQTGNILGTLRYMSPERFSGPCDARGDIYGLGATLYEMLALRPLFESKDHLALIDCIKNQKPAGLRTVDSTIPLDLETIVAKATEKSPARRYPSAQALREDLQRFLNGQPIQARPVGAMERLGLWAKNNRAIASLLTIVAVGLIAGTIASTWVAVRFRSSAIEQTKLARKETVARTKAEGIVEFLQNSFASIEPGESGRDVKVYDVLLRERNDIVAAFPDDSVTQAALLRSIAGALNSLGEHAEAADSLEVAFKQLEEAGLKDHVMYTECLGDLLSAYKGAGRTDDLVAIAQDAYERARRLHPDYEELVLATTVNLGAIYFSLGQDEQAVTHLETAAKHARELLGNEDEETLELLSMLANALAWCSRKDEATVLAREVYDTSTRVFGEDAYQTARAAERLLYSASFEDESERSALRTQVIRIYERELGPNHVDVLAIKSRQAQAWAASGRLEEALVILKQSHSAYVEARGKSNVKTLNAQAEIAQTLMRAGQYDDAFPIFEEVRSLGLAANLATHPLFLRPQRKFALAHDRAGNLDEAIKLYQWTYETSLKAHGPDHKETIKSLDALGMLHLRMGQFQEAAELLALIAKQSSEQLGEGHPTSLKLLAYLTQAHLGNRDSSAATATAKQLLTRIEQTPDADRRALGFTHQALAQAALVEKRNDDALKHAQKALRAAAEEDQRQLATFWLSLAKLAKKETGSDLIVADVETAHDKLIADLNATKATTRWTAVRAGEVAAAVFQSLGDEQSAEHWRDRALRARNAVERLLAKQDSFD